MLHGRPVTGLERDVIVVMMSVLVLCVVVDVPQLVMFDTPDVLVEREDGRSHDPVDSVRRDQQDGQAGQTLVDSRHRNLPDLQGQVIVATCAAIVKDAIGDRR